MLGARGAAEHGDPLSLDPHAGGPAFPALLAQRGSPAVGASTMLEHLAVFSTKPADLSDLFGPILVYLAELAPKVRQGLGEVAEESLGFDSRKQQRCPGGRARSSTADKTAVGFVGDGRTSRTVAASTTPTRCAGAGRKDSESQRPETGSQRSGRATRSGRPRIGGVGG